MGTVGSLIFGFVRPNGFTTSDQPNFISVVELAEQIKDRKEIRLIDLRDSMEYQAFHLPGALQEDNLKPEEGTPYIVYSGDDLLARRFWNGLNESEREQVQVLSHGMDLGFIRAGPVNRSSGDRAVPVLALALEAMARRSRCLRRGHMACI